MDTDKHTPTEAKVFADADGNGKNARLLNTGDDSKDDEHTLVKLRDLFQGLEASARLLSQHVDLADYDTDLVAYCMTMAREAERGYMLVGEVMEPAA